MYLINRWEKKSFVATLNAQTGLHSYCDTWVSLANGHGPRAGPAQGVPVGDTAWGWPWHYGCNTSLGTMDVNAVDWQGTVVSGDICVNVDVV